MSILKSQELAKWGRSCRLSSQEEDRESSQLDAFEKVGVLEVGCLWSALWARI